MRFQHVIILLLLANISTTCRQETKREPTKVEYKEVTLVDLVDDAPLPPPNLTSKFKTLQDWLYSICDDVKPEKSITSFNFGLFESPDNNILYLVGVNKYSKGDSSHTRIEFEPQNMYYKLPKNEYKSLNRDQSLNRLADQLKAFTNTEKFRSSFLANSNAIIFESTGQKIWSK